MKKVILVFLIISYSLTKAQINYQWNEIDIKVNNFHLNSDYNHNQIISLIGTPDEVVEGGQQVIDEFGYNTFDYRYGNSYVLIRGNIISDVFIKDENLSINGIKVGDSISKAKTLFTKYNQKVDYIVVFYGVVPICFFYDSNNIITEITYVVPL